VANRTPPPSSERIRYFLGRVEAAIDVVQHEREAISLDLDDGSLNPSFNIQTSLRFLMVGMPIGHEVPVINNKTE